MFLTGRAQYIRTCSTNLYLRISVALVCMRESRPGDGQLCFCQRDRCNSIPSMHDPTSHARAMTLALCLVVSLLAPVFGIPTRSEVASGTFRTSPETLVAAPTSRKTSGERLMVSAATSKVSSPGISSYRQRIQPFKMNRRKLRSSLQLALPQRTTLLFRDYLPRSPKNWR